MEKNLTKADWEHIGKEISVRKKRGKTSQVCFNGAPLEDAKVKKEVSRYFFEYRLVGSDKFNPFTYLLFCHYSNHFGSETASTMDFNIQIQTPPALSFIPDHVNNVSPVHVASSMVTIRKRKAEVTPQTGFSSRKMICTTGKLLVTDLTILAKDIVRQQARNAHTTLVRFVDNSNLPFFQAKGFLKALNIRKSFLLRGRYD